MLQDLLDRSTSNALNECQMMPLDEIYMPIDLHLQSSWIDEFTSKTSDQDTTSTATFATSEEPTIIASPSTGILALVLRLQPLAF